MPESPLYNQLLQRATSIGADNPPVQQAIMPVAPPGGLMTKAGSIFDHPWVNPANQSGIKGLLEEMSRMGTMNTLGDLWRNRSMIKDYANKGLDWMLGYDPNAKPVGDPYDASKPTLDIESKM